MKILISIPTFNRFDMLNQLAENLKLVDNIEKHNISIYDDCSFEYDMSKLKELFTTATITQNKQNLGADRNSFKIIQEFVLTDNKNDILFLCDSDLIVNQKSLTFIENNIKKTQGFLSLLNATNHEFYKDIDDIFIQKKTVGSAGIVMTKEIAKKIVENTTYKETIMLDWHICNLLDENSIKIYVSKRSYVQHAGIDGENSTFLLFDYGKNYITGSQLEKDRIATLNQQFLNYYITTADTTKFKVILRKILRESWRKTFAKIFSQKLLLKILLFVKQ